MTLHEAIEKLLIQQSRPMTTSEIAGVLNKNGWYTKKDGSLITPYQIHGRTKNYPNLFEKDGSTVSLKSNTGILPIFIQPSAGKTSVSEASKDAGLMVKVLMNEKNFKSAGEIDGEVPNVPGLYCIRIKDVNKLSAPFSNVLKERNHNILYIGIASQSLSGRFLGQELRAKGHGTFFRSLGVVLGFRPEPGSLKDRKNQNNFTFSTDNESKIIQWINQNLMVNWIALNENLNSIEDDLIKQHLLLLNIAGNPGALNELKELREECKMIGRS